jgi:hypothetical protein
MLYPMANNVPTFSLATIGDPASSTLYTGHGPGVTEMWQSYDVIGEPILVERHGRTYRIAVIRVSESGLVHVVGARQRKRGGDYVNGDSMWLDESDYPEIVARVRELLAPQRIVSLDEIVAEQDAAITSEIEGDPSDSPTWCEMCHEDHDDDSDDDDVEDEPEQVDEAVCPICDEVHELFFDDAAEHDAARDRARARREDADPVCGEEAEGGRDSMGYVCTERPGHTGRHVARDVDGRAIRVWFPAASQWTFDMREHEVRRDDTDRERARTGRLTDTELDRLRAALIAPLSPSPFDERKLGAAVNSSAAVLAVREAVRFRATQAQGAWRTLQHGSRGERWAAARERTALLADVLAEIDAVIAARLK